MILLISEFDDPIADAFSGALAQPVVRLRRDDLIAAGWWFDPTAPDRACLVAGERACALRDFEVVVCALEQIQPDHVPRVHPEDRAYAATELTALLTAMLATTTVPVLNAPRDGSLCGAPWPAERWAVVARSLGIAHWPLSRCGGPLQRPAQRAAGMGAPAGQCRLTLLDGRLVCGAVSDHGMTQLDAQLLDGTRALATAAGVLTLTATFARRAFDPAESSDHTAPWLLTGVDPYPDLTHPRLPTALSMFLARRRAARIP